jgi:hypothetical protein
MRTTAMDVLAASQYGLATRAQALDWLSPDQLDAWVGHRRLVP